MTYFVNDFGLKMMRRTNGYEYIIRFNGYCIPNVYLGNKNISIMKIKKEIYLPGNCTLHHPLPTLSNIGGFIKLIIQRSWT